MLLDGLWEIFLPQGTSWCTEKFASTGETIAADGIEWSRYETAADSTYTTYANPQPAVSDIVETGEVSHWHVSVKLVKTITNAECY